MASQNEIARPCSEDTLIRVGRWSQIATRPPGQNFDFIFTRAFAGCRPAIKIMLELKELVARPRREIGFHVREEKTGAKSKKS